MLKLNNDAVKYINNTIDTNIPLTDSDYEYLTSAVIQATPVIDLPSLDDMDSEMRLVDMLATYMKSGDPEKGQDILDYMVNNAVRFFRPSIDDIVEEKRDQSEPMRREAAAERNYQQHIWNKERM